MDKLMLIFTALLLVGCELTDYKYECTVNRVEGTFVTNRARIKFSGNRMISLYRFTDDGERRTFMFPAESVACAEMVDG